MVWFWGVGVGVEGGLSGGFFVEFLGVVFCFVLLVFFIVFFLGGGSVCMYVCFVHVCHGLSVFVHFLSLSLSLSLCLSLSVSLSLSIFFDECNG